MRQYMLWRGQLLSVLVLLSLGLGQAQGLFETIDVLLNDWQATWAPPDNARASVVLVSNEAGSPVDQQVAKNLLETFSRAGASDVVILSDNVTAATPFRQAYTAFQAGTVWFPDPLRHVELEEGKGRWRLASGSGEQGVICPVSLSLGAYRSLLNTADAQLPPCFEHALASAKGIQAPPLVRMNFSRGDAFLPMLSMASVLHGDAVSSVVKGRVVVLALDAPAQSFTMSARPPSGRSMPHWHALMLDGILQEQTLKRFPMWAGLCIGVLFFVTIFYGLQWLEPLVAVGVLFVYVALVLLAGWVALLQHGNELPQGYWLTAGVMAFLGSEQLRRDRESMLLRSALIGLRKELRLHAQTEEFYATDEPWRQIIVFVNQCFDMQRSLFLERVSGDHRVKEVAALNCSINDIDEQRRDYERAPYSIAIEKNQPIRLNRDYLKRLNETDQQFLAPLLFGGQVLGFWAFSLRKDFDASADYLRQIQQFGAEIGELFYHRQQWQRANQLDNQFMRRLIRFDAGLGYHRQLENLLPLLLKRHDMLQRFFDCQSTACIAYNLFGQVTHVSARMQQVSQQWGVAFFNYAATDILITLCQLNHAQAQEIVRRVALQKESVSLQVKFPEQAKGCVIEIKPVIFEKTDGTDRDNAAPFDVQALLIELHDNTLQRLLARQIGDVLKDASYKIRNELETLSLVGTVLEQNREAAPAHIFVKNIAERVKIIRNEVTDLQRHVEEIFERDDTSLFPLNIGAHIDDALQKNNALLVSRRITVVKNFPKFIPLVWASPKMLADILEDCIGVLAEDAAVNSEISAALTVSGEKAGQRVCFQLENQGYGVPEDILLSVKGDHEEGARYRKITQVHMRFLREWGGDLSITSTLGKGFLISLYFKAGI